MKGTANDSLSDFFHNLLHEAQAHASKVLKDETAIPTLPLSFLAHFIRERCVLPFHIAARRAEDIEAELEERIPEEHRAIHAYVRTWQSSGAYSLDPSKPVQETWEERVQDVIYPWPTIERVPVPERVDGRLVESHPLAFPMGQVDFRQARLNSTFSAFDYVQHKFRYFYPRCAVSASLGLRSTLHYAKRVTISVHWCISSPNKEH